MVRLVIITLPWQEASIVFQGTKSNFSYSGKVPAVESGGISFHFFLTEHSLETFPFQFPITFTIPFPSTRRVCDFLEELTENEITYTNSKHFLSNEIPPRFVICK